MKDMLYAVLGLISAIVAVWQIVVYVGQKSVAVSNTHIIIAVVCGILAIAFGGLFLSGRVNKQEEIHITQ
jgi:amino acid transporter